MLRTRVRPAALLCRGGFLLLFAAFSSPLHSQAVPASSSSAAGSMLPATTVKSDAAAIQAMQNIMAQSGGEAAWRGIRSVEETFSVLGAGEKTPHVMLLLDDWSLDTTRYRRKVQGQSAPPTDHNGASTFPVNNAGATQLVAPELDQARVLVGRLPAAAAEVMLRRTEYVLKISKSQTCKSGDICVDVYRTQNSTLPPSLDQQWKISGTTGLPITVRYQTSTVGHVAGPVWREVYFLQYATEEGLVVPVSIGMNLRGQRQTWTFVSLKKNAEFDIPKFDQEVAQ